MPDSPGAASSARTQAGDRLARAGDLYQKAASGSGEAHFLRFIERDRTRTTKYQTISRVDRCHRQFHWSKLFASSYMSMGTARTGCFAAARGAAWRENGEN
jgi:hypothetical protein